MMGGLDVPTTGSVLVRGEELSCMTDEQLTSFRRRNIGFVFQNYNLVPILNVFENIVLPVELDGDIVEQQTVVADVSVRMSLLYQRYNADYPDNRYNMQYMALSCV